MIATAEGFIDLHDIVTNTEAQEALRSFALSQDQELDLSAGDRFPWVLWVHHQPAIMDHIRGSRGITQFLAVDFSLVDEKGRSVTAQAFQMDLQRDLKDNISLALIPLDGELFIKPLTINHFTRTAESQWLLDRLAEQRRSSRSPTVDVP